MLGFSKSQVSVRANYIDMTALCFSAPLPFGGGAPRRRLDVQQRVCAAPGACPARRARVQMGTSDDDERDGALDRRTLLLKSAAAVLLALGTPIAASAQEFEKMDALQGTFVKWGAWAEEVTLEGSRLTLI